MKIALAGKPDETIHYQNALRELGVDFMITLRLDELEGCDGLLLPGGGDIDPAFLNEENMGSTDIDPELDIAQFAILSEFANAHKPVLGICRGHQVINVFFGGGLIQDLPDADNTHQWTEETGDKIHLSTAEKGSYIHKLYGDKFVINSAHHQALAKLGQGIVAVQWAEDGTNEAICHETLPIYGVQWHPERMCFAKARPDTVDGSKVLDFFLNECERVAEELATIAESTQA